MKTYELKATILWEITFRERRSRIYDWLNRLTDDLAQNQKREHIWLLHLFCKKKNCARLNINVCGTGDGHLRKEEFNRNPCDKTDKEFVTYTHIYNIREYRYTALNWEKASQRNVKEKLKRTKSFRLYLRTSYSKFCTDHHRSTNLNSGSRSRDAK